MTGTKKKVDNMELWNKVCVTDPDYAKHIVTKSGPRTEIKPQYQMQMATEQFGQYGATWGVKDLDWSVIYDKEEPAQLVLEAVFWFPGGEFPMAVDWPYSDGSEIRKKTLTDFTGKALSKLGFSADVYLGHMQKDDIEAKKKEKAKSAKKEKPAPKSEADMSEAQLLKKAKGEVLILAEQIWPTMPKPKVVEQIKATADRLKVTLDSFDGVHAVKAELDSLLGVKRDVAEIAKEESNG